jgi:DNA/RNA-binding domain of Phe-tRNA-synthetase-like protein
MINVSDAWKSAFPGTHFAVLAMEEVENSSEHHGVEAFKASLEKDLRLKWSGKGRSDLKNAHPFDAYEAYFRKFGQGYPVLHQLESVALKGKPIFSPSALVSCMFMAELKNGILTAGHALERGAAPFLLDVAQGTETYKGLGGREKKLLPGDMFLSDRVGILSSVLHGPDDQSCIALQTGRVLFCCYGVATVAAAELFCHLEEIERLVRILSPSSRRTELAVFP